MKRAKTALLALFSDIRPCKLKITPSTFPIAPGNDAEQIWFGVNLLLILLLNIDIPSHRRYPVSE